MGDIPTQQDASEVMGSQINCNSVRMKMLSPEVAGWGMKTQYLESMEG